MTWRATFIRNGTAHEQGWPERLSRAFIAYVIAALIVVTPLASLILFSEDQDSETVVVEPQSYYVIHVGIYGIGKVQYSISCDGWSSTYLLTLDRINFERFQAGQDYDYMGYETVGMGGSGYAMMGGAVWEIFLVLVNDEWTHATAEIEVDTTAYMSFPAAVLVLGAIGTASYANHIIRDGRKQTERRPSSSEGASGVRRKATIAMAGLAVLLVTIVVVMGHTIPADAFLGLNSVIYRMWFGALACTAIAFSLRLKLQTVKGDPETVLDDLAHRLRISRYRVSQKAGLLSVQISPTSAIKIRAKPAPDGTLVFFQTDATPTGWSIVVMLLILNIIPLFGLALAMFMLYRTTVFASDRILPRLSQLPVPGEPTREVDTHTMLVESLSEGWRLSAEAYEAARSNYQDSILLMVSVSLLLSMVLAAFTGLYVLSESEGNLRLIISILAGFATAVTSSVASWQLLARKSRARIAELRAWTTKLESALSREVASEPFLDGEPSAFELVTESCGEIANWLKARRKASMFREPGSWLLIFFFSAYAVLFALAGAIDFWQGNTVSALLILAVSVASGSVAALTYVRWKRHREVDDGSTVADVTKRFETLKTEMEDYIRSV